MNRAKERVRKERLARNMREMRALLCASLSGERRKRHAWQGKARFFLPFLAVLVLLFGVPCGYGLNGKRKKKSIIHIVK